jgi:hypothetical protein
MATPNEKLDAHFSAIAQTFPPKVQEALRMIGNPARQLLALRRYIRKAKGLEAQWVWSHEQINSYQASPHFARVRMEIEKVRKKFEELNPGYTLGVSPIRDLNRQVALWNGNKTVHTAAEDLRRKSLQEIINYPDAPDLASTEKFRTFLGHCSVNPEPTSAAPGLSDHGQMRAVDFVVMQGHQKITDTGTATIGIQWDVPGWTKKLNDAVTLSKSLFVGPLQHPREPWHYTLPS